MALVVGMLVFGLVVAVAAVLVVREAGRIARQPPPALFDPDDAFDWVVEHLPDDVAATLTPDDVRRILDFQVEYLQRHGVSANGGDHEHVPVPGAPVVFGGADTTDFIVERSAATGAGYLAEQVDGVLYTQLGYLQSIGAIGSEARRFRETPPD